MLKKQKQNARKTENNIVHNFKFHSQVVLSSSSKYFKDFFRHQPGVNIIDLDKVDKEPSLPGSTLDIFPQKMNCEKFLQSE